MSLPLIRPDQDFALWAILLGLAAFGFWCERRAWGRKYSGVMIVITAAIVLSNLRIIPTVAPVYDTIWEYLVPAAIPLLLFKADLKRIFRESGPTLVAFLVGAAAVVIGVMAGLSVVPLGPEKASLAGVFAGTYIGGSLNFAGVAQATSFEQGDLLTAAVAADNVATNIHFLLLLALPGIAAVTRFFPSHHLDNAAAEASQDPGGQDLSGLHRISSLDIAGLVAALGLSFLICAVGFGLAGLMGRAEYGILIITALALMAGLVAPRQVARLSGDYEAGNVLMFIFFGAIGASADIWVLIDMAPVLLVFAMIIITIHMILLFAAGKIMKFDIAEMIVASAALIGGPASAAAIASTKGWRELVTPGILTGSLGYAIGTFIGVGLVDWLA